jgi:hypothetical protein
MQIFKIINVAFLTYYCEVMNKITRDIKKSGFQYIHTYIVRTYTHIHTNYNKGSFIAAVYKRVMDVDYDI